MLVHYVDQTEVFSTKTIGVFSSKWGKRSVGVQDYHSSTLIRNGTLNLLSFFFKRLPVFVIDNQKISNISTYQQIVKCLCATVFSNQQ
jgi:hypothetical protein